MTEVNGKVTRFINVGVLIPLLVRAHFLLPTLQPVVIRFLVTIARRAVVVVTLNAHIRTYVRTYVHHRYIYSPVKTVLEKFKSQMKSFRETL